MIRKEENETSADFLKRITEYNKIPFVSSYAYPSSTIAGKLGFAAQGCFYVERHSDGKCVSEGFATKMAADIMARRLCKDGEGSKVIFENSLYTACAMKDGSLIVTSKRKKEGRHFIGENAPYWIDSIESAVDTKEANALCRAMFQS